MFKCSLVVVAIVTLTLRRTGLLLVVLLTFAATPSQATPVLTAPPTSAERWGIQELTFQDATTYSNPFWDVVIRAKFTGPLGEQVTVRGFFYDVLQWKVRFSPSSVGTWNYRVVYAWPADSAIFTGSFTCTPASPGNHGFIGNSPGAPHSLVQSDGTWFLPIGTNGNAPAVTAALLGFSPDAYQVPSMWGFLAARSINTFRLNIHHQDQFPDTFPWNLDEGSPNLVYGTPGVDRYNLRVGHLIDGWFSQAQANGISMYVCLMDIMDYAPYLFETSPWSTAQGGPFSSLSEMYQTSTGAPMELEEKYVTYVTSRWGACRNLCAWEYVADYGLYCSDAWIARMDSVVRANDPYARPHTLSFADANWAAHDAIDQLPGLTMTDDHFIGPGDYTEFNADSLTNARARHRYGAFAKPVMFGLFSSSPARVRPAPNALVFERVGYWGAVLGGGYPFFWMSSLNDSTDWAYNQAQMDLLGGACRVVARLTNPSSMAPVDRAITSSPSSVRSMCLASDNEYLAYVQNFTNHGTPTSGLSLTLAVPQHPGYQYRAVWLDAATGDSLGGQSGSGSGGSLTLAVPPFLADRLVYVVFTDAPAAVGDAPPIGPALRAWSAPSPFMGSTGIHFSVPRAGYVTVRIFAVDGREVARIFSRSVAAGEYRSSWSPLRSAPGTYFYEVALRTENGGGPSLAARGRVVLLR